MKLRRALLLSDALRGLSVEFFGHDGLRQMQQTFSDQAVVDLTIATNPDHIYQVRSHARRLQVRTEHGRALTPWAQAAARIRIARMIGCPVRLVRDALDELISAAFRSALRQPTYWSPAPGQN